MKEYIKNLVNLKESYDVNRNRLREYLQEYLLFILYKNKFYRDMVFCGGTALRFIHNINRFSEDLDFSLSFKAEKFNFSDFTKTITRELAAAGYTIEVKTKREQNTAVAGAFFKFPGLLFENKVTPHKDEVLAIKLEIDFNPPAGGTEETTSINKNFIFYSCHYDLASLFAGKLNAVLRRKYAKGRDWYDLLWYLTKFKDLEPNYIMLNNGLKQNSTDDLVISRDNLRSELQKVVERMDFAAIRRDVTAFLVFPEEARVLEKETFLQILK
jgi:predicted nucleotidyltransferase component of viral defense system